MSILLTILALILLLCAIPVLVTFAFVWYERANRFPELMEQRFAPKALLFTARLCVTEVLSLCFTALLYPFGSLQPKRSPRTVSGVPILFLHGLFQNRSCWFWLKFRLRRLGYHSLHDINLPPWKDIEPLTEVVYKKVDELRNASGVDKVILVGHSMGGVIARNYIQIRGGADKVEKCILLASPNAGSRLSPFALSRLGKLLLPRSEFLKRLNEAKLPANLPMTAIYSRHDNIVIPFDSGRIDGARNVEVQGLGHISTLYAPSVLKALVGALREGGE